MREQRLADAVGADQHHAGCLGIVQGGRDPLQLRRPPARQPKQSAPPDFMACSAAGMPIGPNALGGKAVYCVY